MKTYTNTKKSQSTYTQEEKDAFKQARMEVVQAKINEGIESVLTSEAWANFLKFAGSFYRYSARNWLLIWTQCPSATHVAGFNAWKARERFVKKGEKGLLIYRPIVKKIEVESGNFESRCVGFATTHVWDVAQTTGAPLPQPPIKPLAAVNQDVIVEARAKNALAKIEDRIVGNGGVWSVATSETDPVLGSANGYMMRGNPKLGTPFKVCVAERETVDMLKTAIHETAHALLHGDLQHLVNAFKKDDDGEADAMIGKTQKELEAESVAFLLCERLGLDASCYSFGYMATWVAGAKTQEGGINGVTLQMVGRISRAVNVIAGWLGLGQEDDSDLDA